MTNLFQYRHAHKSLFLWVFRKVLILMLWIYYIIISQVAVFQQTFKKFMDLVLNIKYVLTRYTNRSNQIQQRVFNTPLRYTTYNFYMSDSHLRIAWHETLYNNVKVISQLCIDHCLLNLITFVCIHGSYIFNDYLNLQEVFFSYKY